MEHLRHIMIRASRRMYTAIACALIASTLCGVPFARAATTLKSTAPKRANIFLAWSLTPNEAQDLSRWDLLVLDMEIGEKTPELLRDIRRRNPHIILLAYVSSQEIRKDATAIGSFAPLRGALGARVQNDWYLTRANSADRVSFWPTAWMLDVTTDWNRVLPQFVHDRVLANGLWDGVMFDNTWDSVSGYVGATRVSDAAWKRGMETLLANMRALNPDALLLGNGASTFPELNGVLYENFPRAAGWSTTLTNAERVRARNALPQFTLINSTADNLDTPQDYQKMRYGLTSALLADSYYAFDFGDQSHESRWWYDEYETDIGKPVGPATNTQTLHNGFAESGVWRRDFSNGLVLVNNSDTPRTVDLETDVEMIHGTQDPEHNTGLITSSINLDAHDGIVALKPLEHTRQSGFVNGAFVRVWDASGAIKRNGFFTYTPEINGGAWVEPITFDDQHAPYTFIASTRTTLKYVQYGSGTELWEVTPRSHYALGYSIARVNTPHGVVLAAVPLAGPVTLYEYALDGTPIQKPRRLTSFVDGATITATDINGDGFDELVIGGHTKKQAMVMAFGETGAHTLLRFAPYGTQRENVWVASGDVNHDGENEIVTAERATTATDIKIFSPRGVLLNSFRVATPHDRAPLAITVDDVDGDGTAEILTIHRDVFATSALTPPVRAAAIPLQK